MSCCPASAGEQLPGDQEWQEFAFDDGQGHVSAHQIVLMASERMPRGIDVVFEHVDCRVPSDTLPDTLLSLIGQLADRPFAGKILR